MAVPTFAELDEWIDSRIRSIDEDLADGETAQAFGRQLQERRAALFDVKAEIRDAVVAESYRLAGFDAMDPTIARLMDGDR